MLKFSKKVEYALISMVHMNRHGDGQLISARELATAFNIPQEVIGKVLQRLARNGFITSVQGVKGGYQLACAASEIDIAGVITAIDGPLKVVGCVEETEDQCSCGQFNYCNMRRPMETIQMRLTDFFAAISLEDFQMNRIPVYQKLTSSPLLSLDNSTGAVNSGPLEN